MILAIDIGNTQCHFAVYNRNHPEVIFGFSALFGNDHDSFYELLSEHLFKHRIDPAMIHSVIISSVVPALSVIVEQMFQQRFPVPYLFVDATMDCGVVFHYDNLKSLGADRVCCSVAAFSKYGGPVIAIDAGTAVTFDCINQHGEFIGGSIMPGFKTAIEGLSSRTAQLPKVDLIVPKQCFATNTKQSIQCGVMYGLIDAIDGMTGRMKAELNDHTQVVITGGFAELIIRYAKTNFIHDPNLLFDGLYNIAGRYKMMRG
jgi:type III pantothenate kinase